MKSISAAALLILIIASLPLSAGEQLLTVAEKSGFTDTSRYGNVISFVEELQKISGNIRVETLCRSVEGRDIPLLILGDPCPYSPGDRGDDRAVIYFQANIHPGEVEGKEAVQMLARDILKGRHADLLEHLVILITPIFNADGNEKVSREHRSNQSGPDMGVGVRHNGQRLDLNRDCIKLESPEVRGFVDRVMGRWDPLLMVDCHTTNGSYHREPVTYSWPLNPNGSREIIRYMREEMMPQISRRLEDEHGTLAVPYGRFVDPARPEKGWRTYNENIRYLTNYVGLRNRFSILDENYVYADYRTRVYGCYNFLLAIARYVSEHRGIMKQMAAAADRKSVSRWKNISDEDHFVIETEVRPLKDKVLIRGYEMEVVSRENGWPRVRKKEKEVDYNLPYLADFVPSRTVRFPYAYLMEQPDPDVIDVILSHGIVLERLSEPAELEVEIFRTSEINNADYLYQGHYLTSLEGEYEKVKKEFPAGSLYITTAQPLGSLAAQLLEPESCDGLVTWNFFDRYLLSQWRRTILPYPVCRLAEPAKLQKRRVMSRE
ncbi:MAG: hypothetical protein GF417_05160 [Candidatus Latescibacteria bacterium]|nr:hypothetical protein [bacterium]MBD3423807.1 hypothetical protein [Candidatus Latescibacterota bacterium]